MRFIYTALVWFFWEGGRWQPRRIIYTALMWFGKRASMGVSMGRGHRKLSM